jgi:uncharacterized protein YifN (PemK superfamily)
MNRTAYVAGKISGLPQENVKEKFKVVVNELREMGYHVVNPLAGTDYSKPWDDTMRSEIKKMLECDEVHLLPDWQESRGAQLERDIALRLGIDIVYH